MNLLIINFEKFKCVLVTQFVPQKVERFRGNVINEVADFCFHKFIVYDGSKLAKKKYNRTARLQNIPQKAK